MILTFGSGDNTHVNIKLLHVEIMHEILPLSLHMPPKMALKKGRILCTISTCDSLILTLIIRSLLLKFRLKVAPYLLLELF